MRSLLLITLCIMILQNPLYSVFSSSDIGTSGAQFLKLGVGARAIGMGESYAAISDDATAAYWNPAGLNQIKEKRISVMHSIWLEDISYDWASYVFPLTDSTIGISLQYVSYGTIDRMDTTGLSVGNFTPNDLALLLSYAKKVEGINLGINFKYISSSIDNESASAIAVDIGAIQKFKEDKLSAGIVFQNIGTGLKYINDEDPLPFNVKLGGAYNLKNNWLISADVNFPADNKMNLCLGGEYSYEVNWDLNIAGRLGYNTKSTDTGGLNGISIGFGALYRDISFDYAFVPFGDLGDTQRISLSFRFE